MTQKVKPALVDLKQTGGYVVGTGMLYRPVVEYEWAARLTSGLTTVAVPALSCITLPPAEEFGWHVTVLPASSLVRARRARIANQTRGEGIYLQDGPIRRGGSLKRLKIGPPLDPLFT
eukprot:1440527-Pyramimonas_sp.AAC.1